jgi:amidase
MGSSKNNNTKLSRRKVISLLGLSAVAVQFPMACDSEHSRKNSTANEPLHYMPLNQISRMIRSKEISSVELTQLLLDRIAVIDKILNSYITVMAESALNSAKELDDELKAGKYRGPMHGVPIAIKDLLFITHTPTTGGHAFRTDSIPGYDSTAVDKLQKAGAVILGKLNLTEGAMGGYHPSFKIPVNPWGPYHPGESSSGSGVATSAGLCFASLGTDTGGSIREPALVNGIVGLRPTPGLVSCYGVLPLAPSMDTVGPITRSVEDAAIMLEVIAGHDPNDPNSLEIQVPDMTGSLKSGIKNIRIGVDKDYIRGGIDPWLSDAILNAADKLADLGAQIVPVDLPGNPEEWDAAWYTICAKEAVTAHKETYPSGRDEYGQFFRDFLDLGNSVTDEQYEAAMAYRENLTSQYKDLFSEVDAIVTPAGGMPGVKSEEVSYGPMSGWDPYLPEFAWHFAGLANIVGIPALAMPCGVSKEGPPPGMQLLGDTLSDPLLCRIGYALEQATSWHEQHPKI